MGIMRFNYRSQAIGRYIDISVVYPTDNLSYFDMSKVGSRHPMMRSDLSQYVPGMKFQTIYLIHGGGDDAQEQQQRRSRRGQMGADPRQRDRHGDAPLVDSGGRAVVGLGHFRMSTSTSAFMPGRSETSFGASFSFTTY